MRKLTSILLMLLITSVVYAENKNNFYASAMNKVKAKKFADISKNECNALQAKMVEKEGTITCNYKVLKWSDVTLCSLDLKKAWRKNKFTLWETKQWTEVDIYSPDKKTARDIRKTNGIGYKIYKTDKVCYKEITKNNLDNDYWGSQIPEEWESPEHAMRAFRLGVKTQKKYNRWISTNWSQDEIKKWIKLGLSSPKQAKKLKEFGMTADNAFKYIQAGVNLRNLDEYQGMSLEEIQDEKAAENKKYAKLRQKAKKEAVANNAKVRKNIQLVKSNKMYTCGFFRLKVGNSTVTLFDNFYGAVEDQLVYIDKTNTSKKYVGNKYTVEIITDIKKVKKELANASILENGTIEMPMRCVLKTKGIFYE